MKDIEDEIPFAVPEGWVWCKTKQLYNIRSAIRIHQTDWQNEGIPFFRGRELIELCKTGKVHPEIFISESLYEENKEKGGVPQKNDLLVSAVGTLGFVHIVEGTKKFYYKDAYILCFENHFNLNPKYTKFVIESNYTQKVIYNGSKGTTVEQLTIENAKDLWFPFPPLTEQQRIVSVIEAIFTQIDLLEQNKADLQTAVKQAKSKILDLAIHGKLVPQDPADEPASVMLERLRAEKEAKIAVGEIKRSKNDSYIYKNSTDNCYYEKFDGKSDVCIDNEIPFDAPNGWMWCRLKNISSEILYGVNESAKQSGSYRLLRITDIQNNYVNWEKVPFADYSENKVEQYLLRNNDIVFARTGATVGKSYLIENLNKAAIHASYLIRIRIFDNLNPKYIKYFFRSLTYWKQITDKTFGIGQPNVNGTSLGRVFISIPPITEQKRIVARIEEIFNALDDIQSNLV